MKERHFVLLLIAYLLTPMAMLAQTSKQELNDQMWVAARRGDAAQVAALLDKGADVNAKFRYGTTALFKAAERGHAEAVKLVISRGVDVTVKDTFYGAGSTISSLSAALRRQKTKQQIRPTKLPTANNCKDTNYENLCPNLHRLEHLSWGCCAS